MFTRPSVSPITHLGTGPHAPTLTPSEVHAAARCTPLVIAPAPAKEKRYL